MAVVIIPTNGGTLTANSGDVLHIPAGATADIVIIGATDLFATKSVNQDHRYCQGDQGSQVERREGASATFDMILPATGIYPYAPAST